MNIDKVGVMGAGVMGSGVAQHLAEKGFKVILIDLSDGILDLSREEIKKNIRFQRFFKKDDFGREPDQIIEAITFTTDTAGLKDSDFVIENVTEKWDIKKEVYPVMDRVCPDHCIFSTNTSAISVTRLGSLTKRPDRVIGTHFMNPVGLKPTVEVIRGYHTSQKTLNITKSFLDAIGKEGIVVNDLPGFVSNRILMLTINEAVFVIQDQVAPAEDVDRIFKTCFGHKMGPLETADLIGLDTILYSIEVLYESYKDSKYRPCPLLKKMVDAGLYGVKSGQGFYNYQT